MRLTVDARPLIDDVNQTAILTSKDVKSEKDVSKSKGVIVITLTLEGAIVELIVWRLLKR